MNTLDLSTLTVILVVVNSVICLIALYLSKKRVSDFLRAKLAESRIRGITGDIFGYSNVDIAREIKTLQRFCRTRNVPLKYFGFSNETELLECARETTVRHSRDPVRAWENTLARVTPYYLKHLEDLKPV